MLRILRCAAVLVVVGFGAWALWRGGRDLPVLPLGDPGFWLWLMAALALYLVSQMVAAQAWGATLAIFSVRLPPGRAATQLLVSQVAKYVPGNVAHLLGRFTLARADGVAGPVATIAMITEVALLLGAGGCLMVLFLVLYPDLVLPLLPGWSDLSMTSASFAVATLIAVGLLGGVWLLMRWIRKHNPATRLDLVRACGPFALHVVNFLLLGLSLSFVLLAIAPGNDVFLLPIPVFIVAWTVGFLMPGSPGGIGTREGLIMLALGLVFGESIALTAALLHRAISITGDLMMFGAGSYYRSALKDLQENP